MGRFKILELRGIVARPSGRNVDKKGMVCETYLEHARGFKHFSHEGRDATELMVRGSYSGYDTIHNWYLCLCTWYKATYGFIIYCQYSYQDELVKHL